MNFDPYDHPIQDDPYPVYRQLRGERPLHHNTEHDFWVLTRHADVNAALRNERVFSNRMGVTLDASAWGPHAHVVMSFLALDPPEQTRLRTLVSAGFTPRRVAALEPKIRQITTHYLDRLLTGPTASFDWIADLAGAVPMDVISEMLGVPEADRDEVRHLADLLVQREDGLRDVPQAGIDASLRLLDYYRALLAERHRQPADDLTSALIAAEDDGDRMTDDEVIAFLFLMVVAGNETTTKLLSNAIYHLGEQHDRVFGDPALIPAWVEETLRFDGSTQLLARYLTEDVTLHGVTAPAGAPLLLALGSANHDEAVFADPDTFDLTRPRDEQGRILSFGAGRHYCLGANLARLEARVVLEEVVRRLRRVEVHREECTRFYSANVRGFATLPVTVEVR